MKQSPLFSVIIPVYNTSAFLEECVNSVLSQVEVDFELILVNDGSTDSSGIMCDTLGSKDDRIKIIHKENGGLSSARNVGINAAKGEFVLFLDSDDYYLIKNGLLCIQQISSGYHPDIICFSYARVSETGTILTKSVIPWKPVTMEQGQDVNLMAENNVYQSSVCIKMIRRSLIVENNLYFEEGVRSEDIEYSGRLLRLANCILFWPEPLYGYRVRKGSITNSVSVTHFMDILNIIERMADEIKVVPENRQVIYGEYLAFQYCTALINWRLAGSPKGNMEAERLRRLAWVIQKRRFRTVRFIERVYHYFGLSITSRLLQINYAVVRL